MELVKLLPFHLVLCLCISFLFIFRLKFRIALAIYQAILWNIFTLGETLEKRSIIQKQIRRQNDKDFFSKIMKNQGFSYYLGHVTGWNVTQINVGK